MEDDEHAKVRGLAANTYNTLSTALPGLQTGFPNFGPLHAA